MGAPFFALFAKSGAFLFHHPVFIRHIRTSDANLECLMPRGLVRYYGAGHLHFITCSCYHRQPILGTPQRRDLLLRVLEQVRESYCLVILGYVVMPEHFHLLIHRAAEGHPLHRNASPETRFRTPGPGGCSAGHVPSRMAAPFLRFQCMDRAQAHREAPLHTPQSGQSRTGRRTRPVAVEQFSVVRLWRSRAGQDKRLATAQDEDPVFSGLRSSTKAPLFAKCAKNGAPSLC